MPIQCKTGIKTQIMELQFKYPGLWLVNANLNNGITTQISLIPACGVAFDVKCLSSPSCVKIDESVFSMPIQGKGIT